MRLANKKTLRLLTVFGIKFNTLQHIYYKSLYYVYYSYSA